MMGWRAVSAAGLHGRGSHKRVFFIGAGIVTTIVMFLLLRCLSFSHACFTYGPWQRLSVFFRGPGDSMCQSSLRRHVCRCRAAPGIPVLRHGMSWTPDDRRPTSYYNKCYYKAHVLRVGFTLEILDPKSNRVAKQSP